MPNSIYYSCKTVLAVCALVIYRRRRPVYLNGGPFDQILIRMKNKMDAETGLGKKYFKKTYAGKPTKRYLKYVEWIDLGEGLNMPDLINGVYDNF